MTTKEIVSWPLKAVKAVWDIGIGLICGLLLVVCVFYYFDVWFEILRKLFFAIRF